ncbi:hypothetical protein [Kitasatospora humi]|nr:hypothetical protein [Kitasatospora humi]
MASFTAPTAVAAVKLLLGRAAAVVLLAAVLAVRPLPALARYRA